MNHNRIALAAIGALALAGSLAFNPASAQVAGSTLLGQSYSELRAVATGWSAKRQLLGQTVYNEKNEKVGKVDDLIVSPDKAVTYAVIGAGGFLGVAKHDVAIPVSLFTKDQDKIVLTGATKETIKAMPAFEYAS